MARACTTALLLLSAASALLSAATALRQPQTVTLRDVHSKRDVTLVGAQYYNPCSIALATRCVEEQEGLGAVVVESCESRWRRTQEVSAGEHRPRAAAERDACDRLHSNQPVNRVLFLSATTRPCWLSRAVRDPHRHAIEPPLRRWSRREI